VYRWVEHTGELELEVEAGTEQGVFEEVFQAMCELLSTEAGQPVTATVDLSAPDRPALLADWVAELAYLAESEGLVPERLVTLELTGSTLTAVVEGHRGTPPQLVKGATYHRLSLEPANDGFRGRVVLDV
jgi:SHS2 domain-containing protein